MHRSNQQHKQDFLCVKQEWINISRAVNRQYRWDWPREPWNWTSWW